MASKYIYDKKFTIKNYIKPYLLVVLFQIITGLLIQVIFSTMSESTLNIIMLMVSLAIIFFIAMRTRVSWWKLLFITLVTNMLIALVLYSLVIVLIILTI